MGWLPKKTVIVPIDFSDESFEALRLGAEFVGERGTLHAVHVLPELSPMEPGVIWHTVDDQSRSRHAQEAIEKRIDETGVKGVSITVGFGDPAREITHFAEKMKADLIVLPSKGRGGALRVLLGSVAERVIHLAHCPVLVLKH
jgi:nucleotide-binding universal stress UspA family protein